MFTFKDFMQILQDAIECEESVDTESEMLENDDIASEFYSVWEGR